MLRSKCAQFTDSAKFAKLPLRAILLALTLVASGCAQTSKVSDVIDTSGLSRGKKAIALVKIGAVDAACKVVSITIGRREDARYRETQTLRIAAAQSNDEPMIAEAELDPGDYHVVAYGCATPRGPFSLGSKGIDGMHGASLASFTLVPGEVVNVGYLRLIAGPGHRQILSRTMTWTVSVTDWPLAELERYKQRRPQLFAAMTTRLMTVTQPHAITADDCGKLTALRAAGKVQAVPRECQPAAPGNAAGATARGRTGT